MKKTELKQLIVETYKELIIEKSIINENLKLAKQNFLDKGLIPQEQFDEIVKLDPTPTKKYVYWLVRTVLKDKIKLGELGNTISEFDVFVKRNSLDKKDIMQYASYDELKKVIDHLNSSTSASSKEAESDYEVILDTPDLYVVSPRT